MNIVNPDRFQAVSLEPFNAGLVQFDVQPGKPAANLKTVKESIEQLAGKGVHLALLPEMWSCGFDNAHLAAHATKTPEMLDALSELAAKHHMLIAGSMPEASGGTIYNTLYLTGENGQIAGRYRKTHLFSLTGEHRYFGAGKENIAVDTALGRFGLMICYDLRFPELCRAAALKGAGAVLVSAQWPLVRIAHWKILIQARAVENQVFVIAVNRCGTDKNLLYGGHSMIAAPDGEILAEADTAPDLVTAHIDPQILAAARKQIPCLMERMPAAYG